MIISLACGLGCMCVGMGMGMCVGMGMGMCVGMGMCGHVCVCICMCGPSVRSSPIISAHLDHLRSSRLGLDRVCTCVRMDVHCAYARMCMYTHACARMHACMHMHTHARMHAHAHACICSPWPRPPQQPRVPPALCGLSPEAPPAWWRCGHSPV